jgi:chaperonin GroEL
MKSNNGGIVKHYNNGQELSTKVLNGVNKLANNVGSTLGPRGRTVGIMYQGENIPMVTKDGVTVAEHITFEDPFENMGAQIVKQAAKQSASNAGDGTTTATILTRGILNRAQKYIVAGASPTEIKRGMDKACEAIVANLKEIARPVQSKQDIEHVATISANNDKGIGTLIANAVDSAGKDGSVLVEEARSINTSLDLIEGFRIDQGWLSSKFITNERQNTAEYHDPLILITDEQIDTVEQIYPALELAAKDQRPLLIVANEVEGQALAALIANAVRGTMKVCAVKSPRYGEERRSILRDLAATVGGVFITREDGLLLKNVQLKQFGRSKSATVSKFATTIVGGQGDEETIETRIEAIKNEIQETEDMATCERLQERITRLASGVAVIRVGAATEVEMIEKKHRIDDALEAVRSALEEGILPGGGVGLIRASTGLYVETDNEEQALGAKIILDAVQEPLRQLCINSGESQDLIVDGVIHKSRNEGYNFLTRNYVDMLNEGIIDPCKVTRCALQNAVSAASTLLTMNYAIVSTKD